MRNIYRKVKKITHNNLSPASGDKPVHKIPLLPQYRAYLDH